MSTPVDPFIACRPGVLRHAWDEVPYDGKAPAFGHVMLNRCMRCGCERRCLVSRVTGEIITRWSYKHPEGYLRAKDATDAAPTSAEYRRMYLAVLLEKEKPKRAPKVHEATATKGKGLRLA